MFFFSHSGSLHCRLDWVSRWVSARGDVCFFPLFHIIAVLLVVRREIADEMWVVERIILHFHFFFYILVG